MERTESKGFEVTGSPESSCFCIPPRSVAAMISILSLSLSMVDALAGPACYCRRGRGLKNLVNWLRILLILMFQMANILLLVASVVENATLVQIYVWYTLAFVAAGAAVALLDYLYQSDGDWALLTFLVELAFLFVTFRCLPIVDTYRKTLQGLTSASCSPAPAPAPSPAPTPMPSSNYIQSKVK